MVSVIMLNGIAPVRNKTMPSMVDHKGNTLNALKEENSNIKRVNLITSLLLVMGHL
jgi:hypothetical protein